MCNYDVECCGNVVMVVGMSSLIRECRHSCMHERYVEWRRYYCQWNKSINFIDRKASFVYFTKLSIVCHYAFIIQSFINFSFFCCAAGRKMRVVTSVRGSWKRCKRRFESWFSRSFREHNDATTETQSTGNGCNDEIHYIESIRSVGQFAWWSCRRQLSVRQLNVSRLVSYKSSQVLQCFMVWFGRQHKECCDNSPTPDDALFKHLATVYAQNHPKMRTGDNCNETFTDGITNGAFWYELNGKCN